MSEGFGPPHRMKEHPMTDRLHTHKPRYGVRQRKGDETTSSACRAAKAADAQHTPGPWEAGTMGNGSPGYVYCDDRTGSAVAKVALEMVNRTGAEIEANARLIAAAPDMREALEMWQRALRGKAMSDEEQAAYNAGRAALAKADPTTEGE